MTELQNRDFADHGVDIVASLNAASAVTPTPSRVTHPFDLSEDELARQFTEHHSATLKFCNSNKRWFEWTGKLWMEMPADSEIHRARVFVRHVGCGAAKLSKASVVANVIKFARADPAHGTDADTWDADHYLLGTPDGVVDLRTGELRPAAPGDFITKQTAVAPAPGKPELWLRVLDEWAGNDPELPRYLQKVCGYALTGDTREHALFFVHGSGGNGKSVFLDTLVSLFGDYSRTASMDTFTASKTDRHLTELAVLQGARLVTASETEEGRSFAESRIKQLTGSDRISARFMRQDLFEFTPQFTLMIVGNHAPRLANVDEALRRRLHMIPFNFKPAHPDRELGQKLREEWPQILQWMIEGCVEWQRTGIIRPSTVDVATADYFDQQDTLGQWLEENCDLGPEYSEHPRSLWYSWGEYARLTGELPGSQMTLGIALKQRGFTSKKSNGKRHWLGIRIKPRKH